LQCDEKSQLPASLTVFNPQHHCSLC